LHCLDLTQQKKHLDRKEQKETETAGSINNGSFLIRMNRYCRNLKLWQILNFHKRRRRMKMSAFLLSAHNLDGKRSRRSMVTKT